MWYNAQMYSRRFVFFQFPSANDLAQKSMDAIAEKAIKKVSIPKSAGILKEAKEALKRGKVKATNEKLKCQDEHSTAHTETKADLAALDAKAEKFAEKPHKLETPSTDPGGAGGSSSTTRKSRSTQKIEKINTSAEEQVLQEAEEGLEAWQNEEVLAETNEKLEKLQSTFAKKYDANPEDKKHFKERFQAFIEEYTEEEVGENGQKIGRKKMKKFWDITKENWKSRKGFFSFIWETGKDFFKWNTVKSGLDSYNLAYELYHKHHDRVGEAVDSAKESAEKAKKAMKARRETMKNSETYLLTVEAMKKAKSKISAAGKAAMVYLMKGRVHGDPKAYFEKAIAAGKEDMAKIAKKQPEIFQKEAGKMGMKIKSMRKRMVIFELTKRTFNWYLHPSERTEEGLGDELVKAAPIYGSYLDVKELFNENSEMPFWARALFATVSVGMDGALILGSVGTLGFGTGFLATARTTGMAALKRGVRGVAGRVAKNSAKNIISREAAVEAIKKGGKGFAGFVKNIPTNAKKALSIRGVKSFGAFMLASEALDRLWNPTAFKAMAVVAAGRAIRSQLTPEQKRLLRLGLIILPVAKQALASKQQG